MEKDEGSDAAMSSGVTGLLADIGAPSPNRHESISLVLLVGVDREAAGAGCIGGLKTGARRGVSKKEPRSKITMQASLCRVRVRWHM